MAGQAPTSNELMMASNKPKVIKAAPLAIQANRRSAKLADIQRLRPGGCARPTTGCGRSASGFAEDMDEDTDVTSLQITRPARRKSVQQDVTVKPADYFQATGLPAVSLISPQALSTCVFTASGMGT
ncbi:hypothetical protein D3C72_1843590 [compost metagenome]